MPAAKDLDESVPSGWCAVLPFAGSPGFGVLPRSVSSAAAAAPAAARPPAIAAAPHLPPTLSVADLAAVATFFVRVVAAGWRLVERGLGGALVLGVLAATVLVAVDAALSALARGARVFAAAFAGVVDRRRAGFLAGVSVAGVSVSAIGTSLF